MKYLPVIFRFALAVGLAATVSSCVIFNGGDDIDIPGGEDDAYVTLSIGTRAHRVDEDPGDYEERKVGIVRMVLYSTNADPASATPADYEVVRAFDFLIKSVNRDENGDFVPGYEEWDPDQFPEYFVQTGYPHGEHMYESTTVADDDYLITWARKVPRRDYKMLILVNANDAESAVPTNVSNTAGTRGGPENMKVWANTSPGRKLSEFLAAAEINTEYMGFNLQNIETDYGFVMTNSMGLVDVPAASLATSVDGAHANPFPVTVDRVVAKIVVKGDPTYWNIPEGASLGNVKWGINNYNKRFYWMRRQTHIVDESFGAGGVGALETDLYPDPYSSSTNIQRASIYAEDPNFDGISGNSTLVEANFLKVDIYDYYALPHYLDPDGYGYEYVLENTMAGGEQHEDVMTSVIVSAQYAPPGFDVGYGYFRYNGVLMSEETALDYYWGRVALPAELTGMVEAMQSASETIDYETEWNRTYLLQIYNNYLYGSRGFSHEGLDYFMEGVCYYNLPIRHTGGDISDRNRYYYGLYGIVRNNIYTVSINGLNGPGSPEVGGKGYLSAEINIMDWSTHETIVDVGEEVE